MQKQIVWVMLAARVPSSVDWRTCMDQAGGFSFMMASGPEHRLAVNFGSRAQGHLTHQAGYQTLKAKGHEALVSRLEAPTFQLWSLAKWHFAEVFCLAA